MTTHDWDTTKEPSECKTTGCTATCDHTGKTGTCTTCGKVLSTSTPPTGHTHELLVVQGTPATCKDPGTQLHYKCKDSSCNKLFSDPEGTKEISQPVVIPATGKHTAPADGTIDQVYPQVGELLSMGAPVMSLLKQDDRYVVFNVREELLNELTMGKTISVMIPALDKKHIDVKIYYIRDMGSYATWRSTKSTGSYDSRTFQIKARPTTTVEGLRPGMTAVYE